MGKKILGPKGLEQLQAALIQILRYNSTSKLEEAYKDFCFHIKNDLATNIGKRKFLGLLASRF
jgi:hypothetical protein